MLELSFCQNLVDASTGELEMNFGEYEFVYPDGEVDTTPTTGKSVEGSESHHARILEYLANADCSWDRCS